MAGAVAAYLGAERALQAGLSAGLDPAEVARNRALLRCWDSFSLALCLPHLPWRLEGVPAAAGEATIVLDGAGEAVTVDPWPFRDDRVELACEGRRLEGRFSDEAVLHATLAEAPWVALRSGAHAGGLTAGRRQGEQALEHPTDRGSTPCSCLYFACRGGVGEGERELLAGGAEAAGRTVEGGERRVLEEPVDAAGAGQLAVLAGIGDRDRLRCVAPDRRGVGRGHQQRPGRRGSDDPDAAPVARQRGDRADQREGAADEERGAEGAVDAADQGLVGPHAHRA